VVLVRGYLNEWATRLAARFRRRIPAVADRIRFIEPLDQHGFFDLLAAADVVLDPVHFNGMNSSLEAFAVGAPVVTLPTDLQRGRHTQAMYRAMEISDAIASDAADYARIAVQIACERDFGNDLRARILERNAVLYENERVVEEFQRFFVEAHERAV
jgi:predicted O-linked N-acetylglucosamine transferase (SPINDLY family)